MDMSQTDTPPPKLSGRTLFTLFGVPWTVTPQSWRFVPPKIVIGLIVAFIVHRDEPVEARIVYGIVYGLLIVTLLFLHIVGHTLSSRWVGAPMDENHITPILIRTTYHDDPPDLPKRVHLGRAVGGPLMNITVGLFTLLIWSQVGGQILLFFVLANLVLAGFILLPLPTIDGEVIWRELRR